MRLSSGELGKVLAGLLANADASLAAVCDQTSEAIIVTFARHEDMIEAASTGLERFFDRMHAVENFHKK
jgi:hypothetical protein